MKSQRCQFFLDVASNVLPADVQRACLFCFDGNECFTRALHHSERDHLVISRHVIIVMMIMLLIVIIVLTIVKTAPTTLIIVVIT